MLEKFANIFKIKDLRNRIGFTLMLLAVYRVGAHIPTPGIDATQLANFFNQNAGGALGLLDLFNGGNTRKLTIFALGIMPYITASIIFQLLTVIYEPLARTLIRPLRFLSRPSETSFSGVSSVSLSSAMRSRPRTVYSTRKMLVKPRLGRRR